jgi:hypothetical protein
MRWSEHRTQVRRILIAACGFEHTEKSQTCKKDENPECENTN